MENSNEKDHKYDNENLVEDVAIAPNMCEKFPHCTPPPNVKNIRKFSSFENSKAWVSI